jgi:hypothetical protein
MNKENWPIVTAELVEVQDFKKITDHLKEVINISHFNK